MKLLLIKNDYYYTKISPGNKYKTKYVTFKAFILQCIGEHILKDNKNSYSFIHIFHSQLFNFNPNPQYNPTSVNALTIFEIV